MKAGNAAGSNADYFSWNNPRRPHSSLSDPTLEVYFAGLQESETAAKPAPT